MKSNLAEHLRNQNRFAEAETLFRENIADLAGFPQNQPFRLEAQSSLSILHLFSGRCAEAESLAQTVVAGRRLPPMEPRLLADALSQLATTLVCGKKWPEAARAAEESLRLRRTSRLSDWGTSAAEGLYGLSLLGMSRPAEAEPLLVNGYQRLVAQEASMPAVEKVRIAEILAGLVQLYRSTDRQPLAAQLAPELDRRLANARVHDQVEKAPR